MSNLQSDVQSISRQHLTQGASQGHNAAREETRGLQIRRPGEVGIALAAANPFSLLRRLFENMDRMFDDIAMGTALRLPGTSRTLGTITRSLQRGGAFGAGMWTPPIEVLERNEKLIIRVDLPGATKENVSVQVTGDSLLISGERMDDRAEERGGLYHSERTYGRFQRVLALPDGVSPDNIEASFENGVLEVSIPIPEQQRMRTIEIKSSREDGTSRAGGYEPHN